MNYTKCPLYGLQSKKLLKHLLHIKDSKLLKQDYITSLISPYIDLKGKQRLIEAPYEELKQIQKRLKTMLAKIAIPDNVFSGIKGRSYVDNALMHIGPNRKNIFKIDLTAFFPSISRETVYRFFFEDLHCSPDVAQALTNLTTIDLEKTKSANINSIYQFLTDKNVDCKNHLISGAPTSQILSYLVNHSMFDEMQKVATDNNIIMTVYVDDITFSSENRISHNFQERISSIVQKYNYQISHTKTKKYTKLYPKLVTGVIIDSSGNATIRNALHKKIIEEFTHFKSHPDDLSSRQRLRGLLTAARQVDSNAFPAIYKHLYTTPKGDQRELNPHLRNHNPPY